VDGIERACKVLMPLLVLLIVILSIFSLMQGDAGAAIRFLFRFDWSYVTPRVVAEALGLGFFSIGVGLAVMVTYASHAGREINLRQVAIVSISVDTLISLVCGLAIFPIVFAYGLSPSAGPGLMFVSLPIAFAQMPFGTVAAIGFFLLLVVAAVSSAISLLEMPTSFLQRRLGLSRAGATVIAGFTCWMIGLLSVLSFSVWSEWFPLARIPSFTKATFFDVLDYVTSNLMLPLAGLALSVFGGWVLPAGYIKQELRLGSVGSHVLRIGLRYVAPLIITAVMLVPLMF
jgi:NSS family neurotransmitter:Na+ symporter